MIMSGDGFGPAALCFCLAAGVTGLELVTTKYPRSPYFCVLGVGWFWVYVVIYGIIGAGAYLALPLISDQVTVTGIGISNSWIKAAIVGISIKALLHIRLATVSTGPGTQFPLGIETIVQIFEPWMLRNLELANWNCLVAFVTPRAARIASVNDARTLAKSNPPVVLSAAERAAFNADIDAKTSSVDVIIVYLNYSGITATKRVFPA
jgi:hypothetical protein